MSRSTWRNSRTSLIFVLDLVLSSGACAPYAQYATYAATDGSTLTGDSLWSDTSRAAIRASAAHDLNCPAAKLASVNIVNQHACFIDACGWRGSYELASGPRMMEVLSGPQYGKSGHAYHFDWQVVLMSRTSLTPPASQP